jgi:hypothetical protein
MSWHTKPKDDAWKRVTLAHLASLDQHIWLRCNACGYEATVEALAFASFHGLDEGTPLLKISERLACTACGEHKAHC